MTEPHALGKFFRAVPVSRVTDTAELTTLLLDRAPDPKVFEGRAPYFIRSQISNNKPDAYYTRMCGAAPCPVTPTLAACTLGNYAQAAADGVPILAGHDARMLGMGRSLTGTLTGSQGAKGGGQVRVFSDAYILPGTDLAGVPSDQVIDGIRAGMVSDISVGWYGGIIRCMLCNRSIWDWACWHIPGMTYAKNEKQEWVRVSEDEPGGTVALAWIHGAGLSEYSTVYSGATPEAQITDLKAQQEAEGGRVSPQLAMLLQERFRIQLPNAGRRYAAAGGDPATRLAESGEGGDPPDDPASAETDDKEAQHMDPVVEALRAAGIEQTADPAAGVRELAGRMDSVRAALTEIGVGSADPAAELRRLHSRVQELTAQAADGETYRRDVVKAAVAEGVRAAGATFDEKRWTDKFANRDQWSIADIREQAETWTRAADSILKPGRQTVDDTTNKDRPARGGKDAPAPPGAYGLPRARV